MHSDCRLTPEPSPEARARPRAGCLKRGHHAAPREGRRRGEVVPTKHRAEVGPQMKTAPSPGKGGKEF